MQLAWLGNSEAKLDHVLIVSGGLKDPTLKLVDVGRFLYRGQLENNASLARGYIAYVAMTEFGTSEQYLEYAVKAFQPILSAESAVILGGSVGQHLSG